MLRGFAGIGAVLVLAAAAVWLSGAMLETGRIGPTGPGGQVRLPVAMSMADDASAPTLAATPTPLPLVVSRQGDSGIWATPAEFAPPD